VTTWYGFDGQASKTAETEYQYDGIGRRRKTLVKDDGTLVSSTEVWFDAAGRVLQQVQINANPLVGGSDVVQTTLYAYDDLGRLIEVRRGKGQIDPQDLDPEDDNDWQITRYEYALAGRSRETKPNGVQATYVYDAFGHKIQMIADAGGLRRATEWGYDRLGRQVTITGWTDYPGGTAQTTTYTYDGAGRVTQIEYPDAKTISYAYNAGNKVTQRTDQRGIVTVYEYDDNYNLETKTVVMDVDLEGDGDDTVRERFTYDGLNRLLTADKSVWYDGSQTETKISEIVYAYDGLGRIETFDQALFGEATARRIAYTHDQAGFVTSTTYPSGTVIDRTNTWAGQIDTLSQAGTTLVDYAYVGSRPASRAYPAINVATSYTYDNLGRAMAIDAGAERVKFTYTYEPDENNIDTKTFHHRNPVVANDYDYDDLDRLTDVEYLGNPSDVEVFPMNDLGNRVGSVTQRDGVHTYSVDTLTNRYTQIDSAPIGHDDAGNLAQDRQGYRYQYDYENRIVRIYRLSGPTEVTVATFDYDALGRRIRKVDAVAGTTTLYYYDPDWRCLEEWDGAGALQAAYVYGNYIDETLLMDRFEAEYYYLHDHLYSPTALLDGTGTVVERYEYDAYGTVHVMDAGFNLRSTTAYGNPYTFTGRRLDLLDSGNLKLMYYRHRYYDTFAGRFMQHDLAKDGSNLYEYVYSRPNLDLDPSGLWRYAYPPSVRQLYTRTFVIARNVVEWLHDIRGLARLVKLDEDEFPKWGKHAIAWVNGTRECGAWVPNTAIVERGDMRIQKKGGRKSAWDNPFFLQESAAIAAHFRNAGYFTIEAATSTRKSWNKHFSSPDLIAWGFVGHGLEGGLVMSDESLYYGDDAVRVLNHKLAQAILFTCEAGYVNPAWKGRIPTWKDIVSKYGTIHMSTESIVIGGSWRNLPVIHPNTGDS